MKEVGSDAQCAKMSRMTVEEGIKPEAIRADVYQI
jgi:hypothetical protein